MQGSTHCFCNAGYYGDGTTSCDECSQGMYSFAPSVKCSGGCQCLPSEGLSSGTIRYSDYLGHANCEWMIASPDPISIYFSYLEINGGDDHVYVYECASSSCRHKRKLGTLSGFVNSTCWSCSTYTSSTGYLQVKLRALTSNQNDYYAGFIATWSTALSGCSVCSAGSYVEGSGASACALCTAGTYQNATGASYCHACEPGSYSSVSVTCSGDCDCMPYSGLATSGIISNESRNNAYPTTCKWLIASPGAVSLSFKALEIESGYDYVYVNEC